MSLWMGEPERGKKIKIDEATTGVEETIVEIGDDGNIRKFASGATRDTAENKYDPEGFLSPLVIERYCAYMHKNRIQTDGTLRDSDNWQNGFGFPALMKSTWRHFLDMWLLHRGLRATRFENGRTVVVTMEEALCGLIFNVMAYLHEVLEGNRSKS